LKNTRLGWRRWSIMAARILKGAPFVAIGMRRLAGALPVARKK